MLKKARFAEDGFFVVLLNFSRIVDSVRKIDDETKRNIETIKGYIELFKGVERIALKYKKIIYYSIEKLAELEDDARNKRKS